MNSEIDYPFFTTDQRPGTLIVVEWLDGSGKSTQAVVMQKMLEANGFACHLSEWNSSEKVRQITKRIKKGDSQCPPVVFDMMFAADFMQRYVEDIKGRLEAGMCVICDRYTYTALARGYGRWLPTEGLKNFYDRFFPVPDLTFYFRLPVEKGLERAIGRKPLKHYEAGMDMLYSENILENFSIFQTKIMEAYDAISGKEGIHVIDSSKAVYATTPEVTGILGEYFYRKYGVKLVGAQTK